MLSPIEIDLSDRKAPLELNNLFETQQPIEIDVGSGKGRFLLARAMAHPEINFIGIERQRRRIEKVSRKAANAGLANIRLLHAEIRFTFETLLPDSSVHTLYIFYPDPWPKRRHHQRRLLNSDFVQLAHRKLKPNGCLHFSTDHLDYFKAATTVLDESPLFARTEAFVPAPPETTDFELLFAALGKSANRCSFIAKAAPTDRKE